MAKTKTKTKTDDYPYIRAWGRLVGSHSEYTEDRVAQAREEDAPANAIYRDSNGGWVVTEDVLLPATRAALGLAPLPFRAIDERQLVHQLQMALAADGPMNYVYGLDTVEPQPGDASLRLTFTTGYIAEVRMSVQPLDTATCGT